MSQYAECVKSLIQQGVPSEEAQATCKSVYSSKTTKGIHYRSIVPGATTTAGRLSYEGMLMRDKWRRRKRNPPRHGAARG